MVLEDNFSQVDFFKKKTLFSGTVLRFTAKLSRRHREFPNTLVPQKASLLHSLSISCTTEVYLLQPMSPRGHVIIVQGPRLGSILGFTLNVVHPMGLDKCTMIYIHQ